MLRNSLRKYLPTTYFFSLNFVGVIESRSDYSYFLNFWMWFYAENLRPHAFWSLPFSGFCKILMRNPTNHCSISSIKLFMALIINTYSFKCQLIFNNWEKNEKPFHPVGACLIIHMQSEQARRLEQNATTCFQFFLSLSLFPINDWILQMPHIHHNVIPNPFPHKIIFKSTNFRRSINILALIAHVCNTMCACACVYVQQVNLRILFKSK